MSRQFLAPGGLSAECVQVSGMSIYQTMGPPGPREQALRPPGPEIKLYQFDLSMKFN